MKSRRLVLAVLLACWQIAPAVTSAVTVPTSEKLLKITGGSVQFLAVGRPSAIKIRGKGTAPQGDIHIAGKEVTGEFSFDLGSLDTGIDLRNKHMKEEYLETGKFPKATLKITHLTLPADFADTGFSADGVPFEGILTLHGVPKPVKGTAKITTDHGQATAHVEFSAVLSDFSISIPTYLGIKVADQVSVEVDLTSSGGGAPVTR